MTRDLSLLKTIVFCGTQSGICWAPGGIAENGVTAVEGGGSNDVLRVFKEVNKSCQDVVHVYSERRYEEVGEWGLVKVCSCFQAGASHIVNVDDGRVEAVPWLTAVDPGASAVKVEANIIVAIRIGFDTSGLRCDLRACRRCVEKSDGCNDSGWESLKIYHFA